MKKSGLDEEGLLIQLEELADNLEIKIRYEKIFKEGSFFPGGYCKIKRENLIIINTKASIQDKIEILARALICFDLSQVFIKPALREYLLRYSPDRSSDPLDSQG